MMFGGMFLFWILVVAGIVWLVKYITEQNRSSDTNFEVIGDAIDVLRRRYARGEIDQKEFEQKKKDLLNY